MTVYYTQQDFNSNGNAKITSFKPVRRSGAGAQKGEGSRRRERRVEQAQRRKSKAGAEKKE